LSPVVKTVPEIPSRRAAVASSPELEQLAMSPAPTRTGSLCLGVPTVGVRLAGVASMLPEASPASELFVAYMVSAAAVLLAAKNVTPRERIAVAITAISKVTRPIIGYPPFRA
jgi:hypothetical protein